MPITITITDPTPAQIAALFGLDGDYGGDGTVYQPVMHPPVESKPRATRGKAKPAAEPQSPEDAELAREIAADVAEAPPEPEGAKQVVDAGTGRPAAPAAEVVLTMDEVRANATRLAQSNAPQLKAILGEFGAAKLSEVPADKLPDFAGKVLEALG